jgi:hypothetical protein
MSVSAPPDLSHVDLRPVRRASWQQRLLPLMSVMLVGLTLFFLAATYIQLADLTARIFDAPRLDLKPALSTGLDDANFEAHWKALVILEGNSLERRYHQANVLLMSRVWLRYLGFLTGMILSLVGSVFVLGKMREQATVGSAEGGGWKLAVNSTSPGLILAVLGTVLMVIALVTNPAVKVSDGRAYLGNENSPLPGVEQ